jgi:acetate kinase
VRVLVVNVGSSSVKLRLLDADDAVVEAHDLSPHDPARAVAETLPGMAPPDAIGHRVVHGGAAFARPLVVDRAVLEELRRTSDLAPLHNPPAIEAIEAALAAAPGVPSVACFDTAFHATMTAAARRYALPREWADRHGLRRYGFHGLSVAYATRRAAELIGTPAAELRLVVCHLGAGASATAVAGGRSVDTTMGFTPMEGLVMATRSGSVDPGLLLWAERRLGVEPAALERILEQESGLAGLAGGEGDMRAVVAGAGRGDEHAREALEVYVHRLRAAIGALAASLGGLDALVFTGGVGEASDRVRTLTCEPLGFLGLRTESTGREAPPDADLDLTAAGATARTLVIRAREDLEIAAETRAALGAR